MLLSLTYLQICGVLFQFVLLSAIILIGCCIRLYNIAKHEDKHSNTEVKEIKPPSSFADLPARQARIIFTKAVKPPYVEAN